MIHANNYDARKHLNKIKTPAMIIHGKKDTIFPIERGTLFTRESRIQNSKYLKNQII